MQIVRAQSRIMKAALPQETVTSNMARRILKLTREEFELLQAKGQHFADDSQASLSLHKLVTQTSENCVSVDYSVPQQGLREALLDHLQEVETELETSSENISVQAEEHIHSSEIILTLGHSRSVENFLKRAIKKRQLLTIIVAECAPACRVSQAAHFWRAIKFKAGSYRLRSGTDYSHTVHYGCNLEYQIYFFNSLANPIRFLKQRYNLS